ncbi:MAG: ABC transporter ATP-binding protein [Bacilli bacterium]|nr:ABC transporter ATP-binding protein [Bacilli bacterium]
MLKLFKNLGKKEYLYMFISIAFIVIQVLLDLKLPDYMSNITTLVQTGGSSQDILIQGVYMLSCAFGSLLTSIIVGYLATYIASKFGETIRGKVYRKILGFSTEEIKDFSVSSLITRTTNDVGQVQMLISFGLQALIKAPIMAVMAITKIAGKNMSFSMLTFAAVVLLLMLIIVIVFIVIPRFKIVQKLTDNLNRITRENLTGIRVVRAFNADIYQKDKFNAANNKLTNTITFNQRVMGIMSPSMSLVMTSLTLAIYVVGSILINEANIMDKLTIFSDMVVFSSYAMQVVMSFMMLVMIFLIYPRASVSAKRVLEVLETEFSIKDGSIKNGKEVGTVEFRNVSFKYPDADEYMIKNVSFKANKGETIAFIGGTGSGKSTLINLIPRFYDATDGSVLVDGVDVKKYKLEALHEKIGYVSQKAFMFKGTIKENINYGKSSLEITSKNIQDAIRVSQAEEFVSKLDKKVDSFIARGGTNVSGGQKQRLSIARAIARCPEIYIFDDTFSALDYKTDLNLRKDLKKYTKDATTLIVAQRIGTIIHADKIIVLENGEVVGVGRHKELLETCQVYKEIATSQLDMEELK